MKIIISKTPVRITFFGGGTDYPDYFDRFNGNTLGITIDKFSYIVLKEKKNSLDKNFFLSYKKIEKKKM